MVVLLLVAVLALLAYRTALQRLHGALLEALGPRASVEAVDLGLTRLEIRGLRVRGETEGRGRWPAADELRAERVTLATTAPLRGAVRVYLMVDAYPAARADLAM